MYSGRTRQASVVVYRIMALRLGGLADLDPAAQCEDFLGLIGIERRHHRAAVALAQDQPALLQAHEGLAHRPLAAAEIRRQPELRQDDARPKLVQHNPTLHRRVDRIFGAQPVISLPYYQ